MTTTATQLNTRKLLSQLANSKSSGCLWFDTELVSWKIYLQQGSLKYVYCSIQLLEQLKYYLYYLGYKQAIAALKELPSSYLTPSTSGTKNSNRQDIYSTVISWLIENKYLDSYQNAQLIKHITSNALVSCLWSDLGTPSWNEGHFLPLWIIDDLPSLDLLKCLAAEEARFKQWQTCTKLLTSIYQCPYFSEDWQQKPLPNSGILKYKTLHELTQVIRGNISISQLSLFLKKDVLNVAKILSPYIDDGIIKLNKAKPPLDRLPNIPRTTENLEIQTSVNKENNHKTINSHNLDRQIWQIVCIDDSPTILKEIKRFLTTDMFKITAVDDPVQAVPVIFRIKPDLILLDITMPKINGYKLCGLLRGSEYCANTPIIMVTGNTGLIDKARAKIAGATDYITKPFTREGLAKVVAKHLR